MRGVIVVVVPEEIEGVLGGHLRSDVWEPRSEGLEETLGTSRRRTSTFDLHGTLDSAARGLSVEEKARVLGEADRRNGCRSGKP